MCDLDFQKKTVKELYVWTWIAILLPALVIFGIVILWALGLTTKLGLYIVASIAIIGSFGIIWWWWALSVVGNLIKSWGDTQQDILDLIEEVKEVRNQMEQAQVRAELVREEHKKMSSIGE